MKKRSIFIAFLLIAVLLAGCSSYSGMKNEAGMNYATDKTGNYNYYHEGTEPSESADDIPGTSYRAADGNIISSRVYIQNADIIMETLKYDESVSGIEALVEKYGGFIQNRTVNGDGAISSGYYSARSARYVFRIPKDNFEPFMSELQQFGSITRNQTYVDDVTDEYYDYKIRLDTLNEQKKRLDELISQAKDINDIIVLENAVEETIYEIESIKGSLNRLESLISYSTISLNLDEVFESTLIRTVPQTFGERVRDRFRNSFENIKNGIEDFGVFIFGSILEIVLVLAVIAVLILIILKINKRAHKKSKKEVDADERPEEKK